MLVDREVELEDVETALASRRAELVVVYGRRGVGKSTLLVEALATRPHLYYQATTRTLPQQLEDLTAALRAYAPDTVLPGVLPSVDAFLEALLQLARGRPEHPLVVVIDELPYLAQADPSLPTILQRWWDEVRRARVRNLKMFLLGSLVSWMEAHTLSEHGALHNRRTGQILIEPLDYAAAAAFYPRYPPEQRIAAYAIWGGLPSYLAEIDPEAPLWENVRAGVLRPGARLADEAQWLRFTDLRADALYASILRAIALGNTRASAIARAVGRGAADDVGYQLQRLVEMRLVRRVVPAHEAHQERSRHTLYRLADHYVAFWYRFVDRLRHLLAVRRYDEALRLIQADFDKYVSELAFEDVCHQFLWRARALDQLPAGLTFDTLGGWWANRADTQDEVDVLALEAGRIVLVGECKWSVQPLADLAGLDAALRAIARDVEPIDRPWRALFSRSGFTPGLRKRAGDPEQRLLLVDPATLFAPSSG